MLQNVVRMFVFFSMFVLVMAHTFLYLLSWDNIVKYFLQINVIQRGYKCIVVEKNIWLYVFIR